MLAMAISMSLGNSEAAACAAATASSSAAAAASGAAPAAAAHSAAAAEAAIACTTAATAATATATATRAQTVRLASVFFENLVAGLDLAASLDGLVALPYLQLCHRLAMHREVQTGGWRRLAEAILAQLLPPPPPALPIAPETALPTAPETALPTAPGGAPALAMPAAASSSSPLLTAISNPKRSAALEVHVALLLLLGLLLARPGSSAAADGGLPHTAPPVAADDVEPDSLHAPMHREQLRSLQRDLATCMCARGLPQALYACAQRLYDAFKALAPVEGGDGIGAGGAGGGSGNGLLTVKETAPEMRTLAPFFTDEFAKAHVDPFVECHRLALDAILRLAQRLHLPGGRIPSAAAPTAAAPVPFAPAAAFGAAPAVSATAASVSTALV